MQIFTQENITKRKATDVLVIPFWQTQEQVQAAVQFPSSTHLTSYLALGDFHAKEGQVHVVFVPDLPEKRVVLVGLGKKEECHLEVIRQAYGNVVLSCMKKKHIYLNVLLPKLAPFQPSTILYAVVEGLVLSNYKFEVKKPSKNEQLIQKIFLLGVKKKDKKIVDEILDVSESVFFTRDLINSNADIVNSEYLAKVAQDLGKLPKVKTEVLDKGQIKKENMNLLLAVNQGSKYPPYFLVVKYTGNPTSKEHTVLIGKGITYDTGGLSLKPAAGMIEMKTDMSGAATVFGVIKALSKLKSKKNVTAVVATTDNAIGPGSYKPGDVFVAMNGKSVEVMNTDAEGRLILADALSYTCKYLKPTQIVDVATLTGAMVVALGEWIAGVMGNDQKLISKLLKSSETTEERLWHMPLPKDYLEMLKSDIADLKNVASHRWGGAILAGLFLQEFVDPKIKWAHMDIAGPSFAPNQKGYIPKGATGFGVRLLLRFIDA
jgi:leucyl aminopeptidase